MARDRDEVRNAVEAYKNLDSLVEQWDAFNRVVHQSKLDVTFKTSVRNSAGYPDHERYHVKISFTCGFNSDHQGSERAHVNLRIQEFIVAQEKAYIIHCVKGWVRRLNQLSVEIPVDVKRILEEGKS